MCRGEGAPQNASLAETETGGDSSPSETMGWGGAGGTHANSKAGIWIFPVEFPLFSRI